jgi:hypothetical protein
MIIDDDALIDDANDEFVHTKEDKSNITLEEVKKPTEKKKPAPK